jgi:hypothetical protein
VLSQWFSNRGQVIQTVNSSLSALGAVVSILTFVGQKAGFPQIPAWLLPASIGFFWRFTGDTPFEFVIPSAANNPLDLPSSEIKKTDDATIQYKNKLYLRFRNNGTRSIIVGPRTEWIEKDLSVSTVDNHVWRVESGNGWDNERDLVVVHAGQKLETWVGLAPDVNEKQFARLKGRSGSLLTSVVPVNNVNLDI